MVTITDATMRSTVWETIYDVLVGITYTSGTQPGIYRDHSDIDQDDSFPRVILFPVNVTAEKKSMGRGHYANRLEIVIDINSQKSKDTDLIADDISKSFEAKNFVGFSYVGGQDAFSINTEVNQKIHMKTITFTFMRG